MTDHALPARRRAGWLWRPDRREELALAAVSLTPGLALLALVIFYPLVEALLLSRTDATILNPAAAQDVGLANFGRLLRDGAFFGALRTTVVFTAGSVGASFVLGMALALALNERFWLRDVLRGLAFLPWVIPGVVVALLWLYLYNPQVGVVDFLIRHTPLAGLAPNWLGSTGWALPALMIANTWNQAPFFVLVFLAGLQTVPDDLLAAAAIDGAGRWGRYRHVTLPHLRPMILIGSSLMVIWNFNNFDLIWATTQGGPVDSTTTLSVLVYRTMFNGSDVGYAAAIGLGWLVILVVLSFFYVRAFEAGRR
jgi:multiple sugar transport system permease protein